LSIGGDGKAGDVVRGSRNRKKKSNYENESAAVCTKIHNPDNCRIQHRRPHLSKSRETRTRSSGLNANAEEQKTNSAGEFRNCRKYHHRDRNIHQPKYSGPPRSPKLKKNLALLESKARSRRDQPTCAGLFPKWQARRPPVDYESGVGSSSLFKPPDRIRKRPCWKKQKPLCFTPADNGDLPSFRSNMKTLSCFVGLALREQSTASLRLARLAREPKSILQRQRR
jgi:hypothetical protein